MRDSWGGNDVLVGGGGGANFLCGDANEMRDSWGGNDVLVGGNGSDNQLYGDAYLHKSGSVICGNDRLISGTGNDAMWGDIAYTGGFAQDLDLTRVTTGKDVFVFGANNGQDIIYDFRRSEDLIELQNIAGVRKFDDLDLSKTIGTNTIIITLGTNTITVIGVTDLSAADFIFT